MERAFGHTSGLGNGSVGVVGSGGRAAGRAADDEKSAEVAVKIESAASSGATGSNKTDAPVAMAVTFANDSFSEVGAEKEDITLGKAGREGDAGLGKGLLDDAVLLVEREVLVHMWMM